MSKRIKDLTAHVPAVGDDFSDVLFGVDRVSAGRSNKVTLQAIIDLLTEALDPTVLVATGNGATDTAALETAATNYDTVYVDTSNAPLVLDQGGLVEVGDVIIRGTDGKQANIQLSNDTQLVFGEYLSPGYSNAWESATVANQSAVTAGSLTNVKVGDLLLLTSDDAISDLHPHITGGSTRPAEFGLVEKVDGTTYHLNVKLVDTYATNVRVYHLPADGSVASTSTKPLAIKSGLVDITFEGSNNNDANNNTPGVIFQTAYRPVVSNVKLADCGAVEFKTCYRFMVDNVKHDGQVDGHRNYAFVVVCSDEGTIQNYDGMDARHHFTTGGYSDQSVAGCRVATNRYNTFQHSRVFCTGAESPEDDTNIAFDTHPEGYGIVFRNITVYLGGDNLIDGATGASPIAFQSRSRATKVIDCTVQGYKAGRGRGVIFYADDCELIDSRISDCWAGVLFRPITQGARVQNGCKVLGGSIHNCRANGILIDGGAGHTIDGATITDCGENASGLNGGSKAAIGFGDYYAQEWATAVTIRNCKMPISAFDSSGDTFSVYAGSVDAAEFTLTGNEMEGYGVASIGLDRSLSSAAPLESKWAKRNGKPAYAYYKRTGHGLVAATDAYSPMTILGTIHDGGIVDSFVGVLVDVIDADSYVVAPAGSIVDIPTALRLATYDPDSNGYYLRWNGAGTYTVSGTGNPDAPQMLEAIAMNYYPGILTARIVSATGSGGGSTAATAAAWQWEEDDNILWEDTGAPIEEE